MADEERVEAGGKPVDLKKRREDITDISFHVLDNFERIEIV